MKFVTVIKLAAATQSAAILCSAAAITNIQLVNTSSTSFVEENTLRAREFRTEATTPASATVASDGSVSFTNRLAWMSAQRVFPGPSGLPLTHGARVSYDLTFTVEDPLSLGYELSIDSAIRGYVGALAEANATGGSLLVFAAGTLMGASFDDGGGFGSLINSISTTTEVVMAQSASSFEQLLVEKSGTYDAGSYTGTRTFTLRFGTVGPNTQAALSNYNIGEANVRFGLDPTYGGFLNAAYPGPDGEAASTHGHFVTVTATPAASVVPEPATVGMFAVGLFIVCCGRRLQAR